LIVISSPEILLCLSLCSLTNCLWLKCLVFLFVFLKEGE
jgi:hypothetical protein